jgi:hypothetical protein
MAVEDAEGALAIGSAYRVRFRALSLLLATDPFPSKDVLTTLLGVQSLLVASSTLAATVGHGPVTKVKAKDYVPYRVALGIAWLMVGIAVGGLAAWWQTYITDPAGVNAPLDVVEAAALVAPLLVIPLFGFKAAGWAKP